MNLTRAEGASWIEEGFMPGDIATMEGAPGIVGRERLILTDGQYFRRMTFVENLVWAFREAVARLRK